MSSLKLLTFVDYPFTNQKDKKIVPTRHLKCFLRSTLIDKEEVLNRYTIDIVDSNNSSSDSYNNNDVKKSSNKEKEKVYNGSCGILIIPQGREIEYMFNSKNGMLELCNNSGYERLIIIKLNRGNKFASLKAIQNELNPFMLQLTPNSNNNNIPYLLPSDDIGIRTEVDRISSEYAGDIIIEDVIIDKTKYRRLIFTSNEGIIQSEVTFKLDKFDFTSLSCNYQKALVIGILLTPLFDNKELFKVTLLGHGAGLFAMFLSSFVSINLVSVELDPVVAKISEQYFGFKNSDKIKLCIEEGKYHLLQLLPETQQSIIFDMDNKSSEVGDIGLSCPPLVFLTREVLDHVYKVLVPGGILLINLVCRDKSLLIELKTLFNEVFGSNVLLPVVEDVNVIVCCIKQKSIALSDIKDFTNKNLLKYEKETKLLLSEFHEIVDWEEFNKIN